MQLDSKQHVDFSHFIPGTQLDGMDANTFTQLQDMFDNIPEMYGTDGLGDNCPVALHYHLGCSEWYVRELDPETGDAFGYAILNGDTQNAEYGDFSLPELASLGATLDLDWDRKTTMGNVLQGLR